MLKLKIVRDYAELSNSAAELLAQIIRRKPDAVVGLATGSTPVGMYQRLVQLHREQGLDFSRVTTFNLDEYAGLAPDHPQSYHSFMYSYLFKHINIARKNIHIPRGDTFDFQRESERYELAISAAGGIDIQVLGIGSNGHIGFNEPGSDFAGRTGLVTLKQSTIEDNARFFSSPQEVPRQAISMGIQTIMSQAKQILLLASGENKADAIRRMIKGEVTPELPASILQRHRCVTVIADHAAASYL